MVVEWVIAFSVAANVFLGLGVYILLSRVPTPDDLLLIGEAIVDKKIQEFGLSPGSEGQGGRPGEGLFDKFLRIPGVQSAISGVIENFTKSVMGHLRKSETVPALSAPGG